MLSVKFLQVLPLDRLDTFNRPVFMQSIRMVCIQDLIKTLAGHLGRILSPDGKMGQDLSPSAFKMFNRKGRFEE